MELFFLLVGLGMFYSWVHAIVIINKRLKSPTSYEKLVLLVALVAFILFTIGVLSN